MILLEHSEPLPIAVSTALAREQFVVLFQWGKCREGVVHHPSGDPTPSQADIQMTKAIIDVARPLGIEVHDHLIVGRDGHASLKGLRPI